jgi:HPt (histidine-containing phosphotransfer) domain-containing protein
MIERSLPDTGTTPSALAPIDRQVLTKIREMLGENGSQLLANVIASYLDESPALLATMHAAIAQSDARMLQKAAHKLKSSSTFLGATVLANICSELERIGRTGTTAGCRDLVLQIEAAYAGVKAALELERADRDGSVLRVGQERG